MHMLNLLYIFNIPQTPVAVTYKLPQICYPEHAHDVDEIVIITSGKGIHTINGNSFETKRGDVFYVRAYDWHQFENVEDLCLFNILCRCTERPETIVLPRYEYLKNPPPHWELRLNTLKNIEDALIPKLDVHCNTVDAATPLMINTIFSQILAYLWHGKLAQSGNGKYVNPKQIIIQLLDFLNDRYADEHTLDSLAKRYDQSERTLNRQFKEYTGLSPMHYLIQLRLYKAIEQLRNTNIPITELAFKCGFNDSNYFSYAFKKKFGVSPVHFIADIKNQVGQYISKSLQ